jgi:hypothetical protein
MNAHSIVIRGLQVAGKKYTAPGTCHLDGMYKSFLDSLATSQTSQSLMGKTTDIANRIHDYEISSIFCLEERSHVPLTRLMLMQGMRYIRMCTTWTRMWWERKNI